MVEERGRGASELSLLFALGVFALPACEPVSTAEARPAPEAVPAVSSTTAKQPIAEPLDLDAVLPEANTEGCPDGMVRVEGEYCPTLLHRCLEHHPEYVKNKGTPGVSERCLRYAKDTRCLAEKREHMSFCMDRFEYPNQVGEKPRVLVTYAQAKSLCASEGKRLCTENEHNFACEGPNMLPYATGHDRDSAACNIDRPYVYPNRDRRMLTSEDCKKDERCSAEMARLDQRHAIGSNTSCASWAGVVDINGNANEWVHRPEKSHPHRGGLKGGWWGPVRNRCRPMTVFHPEPYYGYESGFRCCKAADEG